MGSYAEEYKKRLEQKEKERNIDKDKKHTQPLPVVSGPKEAVLTAVKKEIERDYNNTFDFLILPKHIKMLKLLIIIVASLLILFLVYKNFISAEEFHYNYDIGESNFLSPNYRVSSAGITDSITYRNLTSSLVYFTVPIPRGAEKVKAQVRFKEDYNNTLIMLGAKDREDWHYQWKTLYTKPIQHLTDYQQVDNYYIYKINENLDDKDIQIDNLESEENLVIATNINLKNNPRKTEYSKFTTIINSSLRGGHTFYIYTSGSLYIQVKKQDLNWYNGSDALQIELSDSQNNLLYSSEIDDDGIKTVAPDKNSTNIQSGIFEADYLPEGVYKLEFKNFDGLIKEIKINTDKIVLSNSVYLADSDLFFINTEKNTTLFINNSGKPTKISFKTWHTGGYQNVTINSQKLSIQERVNETYMFIQGNTTITSPKNDIIVTYPGYFAFSKENYFEPYSNRIIQIKNNQDWIGKDIDYLILDYKPPIQDQDWKIGEVEFDLNELYYKDKLSLVFNIPHLGNEQLKNQTIQIDYINITIYKPGVEL